MSAVRRLPEELTIYTVGETRPLLLAWLDATPEEDAAFEVDARPLVEVDGAGAQLLASLARALAARGRALRLVEPGAALREACDVLGTRHLLAESSSSGAAP